MAKRKRKPKIELPPLDWKRARRDETMTSKRRTWESRCKRYKVQESVSKFGMPTTYFAVHNGPDGEEIIKRHKKRGPAEKSCEKHRVKHYAD